VVLVEELLLLKMVKQELRNARLVEEKGKFRVKNK